MRVADQSTAFLADGGEMGALMREQDWSASPLEPPEGWPQSLRSAVGLMLANKHIMFVAWGPELAFLYNDAYRPVFGKKHPWALGRPFREVWSEVWDEVEPLVNAALSGEATWSENLHLVLKRNGYPEDCWFTFSYSPVRDEDGAIVGLFCAASETTEAVLAARRQAFRLQLEERVRDLSNPKDVMAAAVETLGRFLGVSRVGYGEMQADDETIVYETDYADGVDHLIGAFPIDNFGPGNIVDLRRGLTTAYSDVEADTRTADAGFEAIAARAAMAVPLVRDGRLRAVLYLNHREVRDWTADEVSLVQEVAARTWSAVEHARAEVALRDSDSRFRALVNATANVVYRMAPDWRELRRLDGMGFIVDTEAPTDDWIETYIPADERPRVLTAIKQAIRTKSAFDLEHRVLRVDGTVGWTHSRAIPLLDDAGEIVEWFGAASDVTARVKADQSFTRLFEASPAPFLVLAPDAPNFTIIDANDAYLAATMRTREGLVGRAVFDAFPDNPDGVTVGGVSRLRASLEQVLASRQPDELQGLNYDVVRPDGTYEERWWSPVNSPILDEHGEVEAIIHNANDVTEDRRMSAALRESEDRYRQIVEGADDFAIVTLDAHGIITVWNTGAQHLLGYPEAEAVGRHGAMFFTPEDQAAGAPDHEMSLAQECGRALNERWHIRKDGSRFWGSGLMMRFDRDGGGYLKIFRDRTAEHEAEAAVRDSGERLRLFNETLEAQVAERTAERDLLWRTSQDMLVTLQMDGTITAVNRAWTEVLGWGTDELVGSTFIEIVHPDDLALTLVEFAKRVDSPLVEPYEYRLRHKNGEYRWIAWTAGVEGGRVSANGRDVTHAKAREAELAARTTERDRMWDTLRELLLIADLDGVFRAVNPGWTRTLGHTEAETLGRNYRDFIVENEADTMGAAVAMAASGIDINDFENHYRHKDGSVRRIAWHTSAEGGLIYAFGRDVSDERARAAELALAQDALRQAQKMEAMGLLTGGVAHDFNNLLTPIVGGLDMLVRRGIGNERERRLIDGALQSAERAKILVQRLLAFARRQPLQPVAVEISRLLEGMVGLIGSTLGPTINVRVDIDPNLPPAKADSNQLEMAILNLAVNARDAMPDGGELTIRAVRESVRQGRASGVTEGDYVRLSVTDTGAGMDDATRQRAIEPFFSTKGIGKGTGLGLSMVHGLAAQLGGGLTIDSAPGKGTTIELWLPVGTAAIGVEEASTAAPGTRVGRGVALLVDDEELVRMSTADMLIDLGFEVVEAGTAEEALQLLETGTMPNLLITDHLMPGMNGAELARAARAISPTLPILIVSGYAEVDGVAPDLPRLTKPFRNAELAESISALLPVDG